MRASRGSRRRRPTRCARQPPEQETPSPLPDIAVEIRSPSTWRYDIDAKKPGYERVGLPELWLVDTAGVAIFVFRRSAPKGPRFDVALELAAQDALTSPLLPGFELAVGALIEG